MQDKICFVKETSHLSSSHEKSGHCSCPSVASSTGPLFLGPLLKCQPRRGSQTRPSLSPTRAHTRSGHQGGEEGGPGWGQVWAATPSLPLRRIPRGPWGPGNLHSCAQHPGPAAALGASRQKGDHLRTFPGRAASALGRLQHLRCTSAPRGPPRERPRALPRGPDPCPPKSLSGVTLASAPLSCQSPRGSPRLRMCGSVSLPHFLAIEHVSLHQPLLLTHAWLVRLLSLGTLDLLLPAFPHGPRSGLERERRHGLPRETSLVSSMELKIIKDHVLNHFWKVKSPTSALLAKSASCLRGVKLLKLLQTSFKKSTRESDTRELISVFFGSIWSVLKLYKTAFLSC